MERKEFVDQFNEIIKKRYCVNIYDIAERAAIIIARQYHKDGLTVKQAADDFGNKFNLIERRE